MNDINSIVLDDNNIEINKLIDERLTTFAKSVGINYNPTSILKNFKEDNISWNYDNTISLLRAAILAYETKDSVKLAINKINQDDDSPNVINHKWFEKNNRTTDTQAFGISTKKSIILSFRGTETNDFSNQFKDLITDIKFKRVPLRLNGIEDNERKVHKGFQTGLDLIWKDVEKFLHNENARDKTIWLTGHSLGGALATVATAKLVFERKFKLDNIGGLYTIGCPRVLEKKVARELSDKISDRVFRIHKSRDPIPLIPTPIWFYHVSGDHRCFIESDGDFILDASNKHRYKDRIFGWGFIGLRLLISTLVPKIRFNFSLLIADHDSNNYLNSIIDAKIINEKTYGNHEA